MTEQIPGLTGQNRGATEKISEIIYNCELHNGYIFKNFFAFNSVKGRPVITFLSSGIISNNRTVDNQIYAGSYILGDEMNGTWNERIPIDQREVSLTYDLTQMQAMVGRIKKKDQARLIIAQSRLASDPHNFSGPGSSDDFIIYLSCGSGGEGREGLRCVAATRVQRDNTLINYPKDDYWMLSIPIHEFRKMIESFSKCKKDTIRIKYYPNTIDGVKSRPGIMIGTVVNGIMHDNIEKFGDIPDEMSENNMMTVQWPKLDESAIVRNPGASQLIIEVERPAEPTEFEFSANKVVTFTKFAAMHNESSVRIYYQPGKNLLLAYRFGAFGEAEICLSNSYAKF